VAIAEGLDLVQEIDAWVIKHAIALLAGDQTPARLPLHVNLSGRSIGDPKLLLRFPGLRPKPVALSGQQTSPGQSTRPTSPTSSFQTRAPYGPNGLSI